MTPFGKVERRRVEQLRPGEVLQDENTVSTGTGLRKIANEEGYGILGADTGTAVRILGKSSAQAAKDGWVDRAAEAAMGRLQGVRRTLLDDGLLGRKRRGKQILSRRRVRSPRAAGAEDSPAAFARSSGRFMDAVSNAFAIEHHKASCV